jgi:retron-type reverse transcriptase
VESGMTMRRILRQMSAPAERSGKGQGEALSETGSYKARRPRPEAEDTVPGLLTAVLAREKMQQPWKRVRANKGAAGIDGLEIDETVERLMWEWPLIRELLLHGTYRPQPVRRVMIPKPEGGERELGIPTVTDRLILKTAVT